MTADTVKLNSKQMAEFAARGFLRFDSIVPQELNDKFLKEVGHVPLEEVNNPLQHYGKVMASSAIPVLRPGSLLSDAYPDTSAIHNILNLPFVEGAIESLVGEKPFFDHHFLHITFPPKFYEGGSQQKSQHYHQDSTIDPRQAFDVQMMYYPHDVTVDMGGTRFLPGSHLRVVSEAAIGRYQNIVGQQRMVCPAGTLLFLHMGIWHGGGLNMSDQMRYMFKIRMNPGERQMRLWDTSDLGNDHFQQRPIFWTGTDRGNEVHQTLMKMEPWFEADTGRLEMMNRVRFWRYLLGDNNFDADYWLTRVEREYA
ncbi:MAG: hypothetical protein ACI805_001251 [Candidatus Azotimanducaceae bacterium]|jgi:hypothetical protein